jgi:hypothetical protein
MAECVALAQDRWTIEKVRPVGSMPKLVKTAIGGFGSKQTQLWQLQRCHQEHSIDWIDLARLNLQQEIYLKF